MRKIQLYRAVIFFVVLVGGCFAAEAILVHFIKKNYNLKPSLIASGTIQADILVQGPSMVAYGIDPRVIEEKTGKTAYNLGIDNSVIDEHIALYDLYLKYNKKPSLILMGITPYGFSKGWGVFHSYLYTPYLQDPDIAALVKREDSKLYTFRNFPLLRHTLYNTVELQEVREGLQETYLHKKFDLSSKGFIREDIEWTGNFDNFKKAHPNGMNIDVDSTVVIRWIEYMRKVKRDGIRLCFYEPPLLREALPYFKNRDQVLKMIDSVCHAEGVPFISFHDLPVKIDKPYFYDSMHLKGSSVGWVTGMICDSLQKRGIIK
jgi:hypothetical protein